MKITIERWLIKRSGLGGNGDYVVIECSDIYLAVGDIDNAIKKLDEYEIEIEDKDDNNRRS
jgi:hypothetical protein